MHQNAAPLAGEPAGVGKDRSTHGSTDENTVTPNSFQTSEEGASTLIAKGLVGLTGDQDQQALACRSRTQKGIEICISAALWMLRIVGSDILIFDVDLLTSS